MQLPYLTREFPGIGGSIKDRPEDFFVQEMPLYEPSGEGEHVYTEIQKVGLTTFAAIDRIARTHNVHPRDIGYAGLKDARAITRQVISIPRVTEEAVMTTKIDGLEFLWAAKHLNKIRLGHYLGQQVAGHALAPPRGQDGQVVDVNLVNHAPEGAKGGPPGR